MDPLSIATSTAALVGATAKVVKLLHELHGTLQDAPLLLSSIINECTIVHTSLCVIQNRQIRLASSNGSQPDQIFVTFDVALASCTLILSVLEKDVQSCLVANKNPQDVGAVKRAKLVLSKDHLQELVFQLRGQAQAINLLLTSTQSDSIDQIRNNVEDHRDLLQGIAKVAKRFYVESEYEPSIGEASGAFASDVEIDSMVTSTRFAFDAEVLASKRYQRTIEYLHRMENRRAELSNVKTVTGGTIVHSLPTSINQAAMGDDAASLASAATGNDNVDGNEEISAYTQSINTRELDNGIDTGPPPESTSIASPVRKVRANFAYKSSAENELTIEAEDIMILVSQSKNGWSLCRDQQTNARGWVPSTYIEEIAQMDSSPPALPALTWTTPPETPLLPNISVEAFVFDYEQNTGQSGKIPLDLSEHRNDTDTSLPGAAVESLVSTKLPELSISAGNHRRSVSDVLTSTRTQELLRARSRTPTDQGRTSSDTLSPLAPQSTQRPLRPSKEWLNEAFNLLWAKPSVGSQYQARTSTIRKIVFVGDPCVGMTSAITRAVDGNWMVQYRPTVLDEYSLDVTLNGAKFNLRIWDTAGEHADHLRTLSYAQAHVVVIGFAVDSPDTLANVREHWVDEVSKHCPGTPTILVGCKADLRFNTRTVEMLDRLSEKPVSFGQGLSVARRVDALAYVECSSRAEEGGGIAALFETIVQCSVIHEQQKNPHNSLRQKRSRLGFGRLRSKSSSDLPSIASATTTFVLNGGRLISTQRARSIKPMTDHEPTPTPMPTPMPDLSHDFEPETIPDHIDSTENQITGAFQQGIRTPAEKMQEYSILRIEEIRERRAKKEDARNTIVSVKVTTTQTGQGSAVPSNTLLVSLRYGQQYSIVRNRSALIDLHTWIKFTFPDLNGTTGKECVIPNISLDPNDSGGRWEAAVIDRFLEWLIHTPIVITQRIVQLFFSVDADENMMNINYLKKKANEPSEMVHELNASP